MRQWTITLPLPCSQNSATWRNRWTQRRYRREWADEVGWRCREARTPELERIALEVTVYFQDNRNRDLDNYHPTTIKATQDALTPVTRNKPYGIGIIDGDDCRYIPELPSLRFELDPANPRTEITIREIG